MGISQFTNISSWRKNDITIAPHEVFTLNFNQTNTNPNIFVINNPNQATLKIGISSIPREDSYEFKVEYNTNETMGRPIGSKNIYILNDSSITVKVTVFSIEKEFDPAILKNMNISLEGYTIESSSEISGFKEGIVLPIQLDGIAFELFNTMLEVIQEMSRTHGLMLEQIEGTNTRLGTVIEKLEPMYNHYVNNQEG